MHYCENLLDLKITGPMKLDVQGRAVYREHMNCICGQGYEFHTLRVVEFIFPFTNAFLCILSCCFVLPLFKVLEWEAIAMFVSHDPTLGWYNQISRIRIA